MANAEKAAQIERIIQKLKILGFVSTTENQDTVPALQANPQKADSTLASICPPEQTASEILQGLKANQSKLRNIEIAL